MVSPFDARAQNTISKIPLIKIPLDIKDQAITITTSAILTVWSSKDPSQWTVNLGITGDLSDLENNLSGFLSSQMDKEDRCGERLTIQNATLTPAPPATSAVIQLHFERFECVKLLGKQAAKKLIGGRRTGPD